MNYGSSFGCYVTKSVNMRHDIMSNLSLLRRRHLVIDIMNIRLHLGDLFLSYRCAKLLKRNNKCNVF